MVSQRRRVGDTLTVLPVLFQQKNTSGVLTAVDLTGFTVTFEMRNAASLEQKIKATTTGVSITTAASGEGEYTFLAAGVDEPGKYWGTFTATSGGSSDSFPAQQNALEILIDGDGISAEDAFHRDMQGYAGLPGLPDELVIGDSYVSDFSNKLQLLVRDTNGTPLSAIGSKNFSDGDFTASLRIWQGAEANIVEATCAWVASGDGYIDTALTSFETRKAAPGQATAQLVLKWDGGLEYEVGRQTIEWVRKI